MSSSKIFSSESCFSKDLEIPTSKSYINRLLILGSLVAEEFTISKVTYSQDVKDLIDLLIQVGLEISIDDSTVIIKNSFPACEQRSLDLITLKSGPGGTTNRFLIALLSRGRNSYQLIPDKRLFKRPMQEMWSILADSNVALTKTSNEEWPIFQGPIEFPRNLKIDTKNTTQIASALLMQTLNSECEVVINNKKHSYDYYRLTESLLAKVKNGVREIVVPYDFSSLSYLIAYGAVIRPISISGIDSIDSFQPDSKLVEILQKSGCEIEISCKGIYVEPATLVCLDVDCSGFPDLVPTLCFVAAYASGTSKLRNIKNLKLKESNRVEELLSILSSFNIDSVYDSNLDVLEVKSGENNTPFLKYCSPEDHRMAMVAMLFVIKNGGGVIENFECVRKSFPALLNDNSFC